MENNDAKKTTDELPRSVLFWMLAVLGAAVFGLVVGYNLAAADLPLWPDNAAPASSITTSR